MMDESTACEIITWTDEPDLLAEPGEPIPVFTAAEITEARIVGAMMERDIFRPTLQ